MLIGATHEYGLEPLLPDAVKCDLSKRAYGLAPFVWKHGNVVKITSGIRVQSNRGRYGRLPIIGRWENESFHKNSWLFTGLSARGLLYHGIFGSFLCEMILNNCEKKIFEKYPELSWWKSAR